MPCLLIIVCFTVVCICITVFGIIVVWLIERLRSRESCDDRVCQAKDTVWSMLVVSLGLVGKWIDTFDGGGKYLEGACVSSPHWEKRVLVI